MLRTIAAACVDALFPTGLPRRLKTQRQKMIGRSLLGDVVAIPKWFLQYHIDRAIPFSMFFFFPCVPMLTSHPPGMLCPSYHDIILYSSTNIRYGCSPAHVHDIVQLRSRSSSCLVAVLSWVFVFCIVAGLTEVFFVLFCFFSVSLNSPIRFTRLWAALPSKAGRANSL